MSGICGIIHLDGMPVTEEDIKGMVSEISHLGPDGSGKWIESSVGLGNLMLHSTPESLMETLPLINASGELVITADARIDNRDSLFESLAVPQPERAFLPDSWLILRAYEKWEKECTEHLLGDFSFAVWDRKRQRLFCARDHMGIRPFFYYHTPRLFVFASEMKAILTLKGMPNKLNELKLAEYLIFTELDKETTIHEGILRLPGAHFLTIGPGVFQKKRYWSLSRYREIHLRSDTDYVDAFRERFFAAVKARIRSSHPVASLLSGGLDSTSVACVSARLLRERGDRLVTYSWVLPEGDDCPIPDERKYISSVLEQEDVESYYILAEGKSPFDNLSQALRIFDGPPEDGAFYMNSTTLEVASSQGMRVLLSGVGGDEAASSSGKGYLIYLLRKCRLIEMLREVQAHAQIKKRSSWKIFKNHIISTLLPRKVFDLYMSLKKGAQHDEDSIKTSVIHPIFARQVQLRKILRMSEPEPFRRWIGHSVRENQYRLLTFGHIANVMDRIFSVAFHYNMEYRFPFLDKELLEFCVALPPEQHFRGGWGRFILRRAMEGILPPVIQWRHDKTLTHPDYTRRIIKAREGILPELRKWRNDKKVAQYIDLPKIERIMNEMPLIYNKNGVDIRSEVIFRGVALGHFLFSKNSSCNS